MLGVPLPWYPCNPESPSATGLCRASFGHPVSPSEVTSQPGTRTGTKGTESATGSESIELVLCDAGLMMHQGGLWLAGTGLASMSSCGPCRAGRHVEMRRRREAEQAPATATMYLY